MMIKGKEEIRTVQSLSHVSKETQAISHKLHNNEPIALPEDRDVEVVLVV